MSRTFEDLDVVIVADAFSAELEKHVAAGAPIDNSAQPGAPLHPTLGDPVEQPVDAAARLLEVAALNADQLVAEAREEAERLVLEARVEAEKVRAESEAEHRRLADEIAALRLEQREYQERMRAYLNEMLTKVEAGVGG